MLVETVLFNSLSTRYQRVLIAALKATSYLQSQWSTGPLQNCNNTINSWSLVLRYISGTPQTALQRLLCPFFSAFSVFVCLFVCLTRKVKSNNNNKLHRWECFLRSVQTNSKRRRAWSFQDCWLCCYLMYVQFSMRLTIHLGFSNTTCE